MSQQEKIPQGWIEVSLGDVIEFKYGKALPAKIRDGEHFPVYGSNGIVGYHSKPIVNGPALIVGRKGSIGEVHLSEEDFSPIDTTYFVDEFHGQPPSFWFHRLRCLNLADLNRATALPGLNRNDAYQLRLLLPPLKEQYRIVEKIEALQARSSKARKALDAIPSFLEKFRQSVLSSAFRGGLTADWRAQNPDIEPAEKLLERIRKERRERWEENELAKMKAKGKTPKDDKWKDKYKEPEPVDTSDLPELPEGWCWATLSELSSAVNPIGYGVLQPGNEVEDGARLVRVCDLEDGKVLTKQLRTISSEVDNKYTRTRLKGGELLVTVVGTIGRVAIAPKDIAGANVARAVARLTATKPIKATWLLRMLSSSFLQDWLVKSAREVARKTLNIGVLGKTPVPLCSVDEMQEGLDKVGELLSCLPPLSKIAQENLNYISSLDQSILFKAFRGELVPQDPNDEPADQLLIKIREQKIFAEETTKKNRAKKGKRAPKSSKGRVIRINVENKVSAEETIYSTMSSELSEKANELAVFLVDNFGDKSFTVEMLREKYSSSYDNLKDILFELLKANTISMEQKNNRFEMRILKPKKQ